MMMKKLLCCLCLLIGLQELSHAERVISVLYRASGVSFCERTDNGTWGNWSEWKKVTAMVSYASEYEQREQIKQVKIETIDIYDDLIIDDTYDLIENLGKTESDNGTQLQTWRAVDEDGIKCLFQIRTKNGEWQQVYAKYNNLMVAYNIKPLV